MHQKENGGTRRALKPEDFKMGKAHVAARVQELADWLTPAESLYAGGQHGALMNGIEAIRSRTKKDGSPFEIDLWILSAGFGLVSGHAKLPPYDCTFNDMRP